tara:strand:+ start:140 stop:523 length:384 start_codon:yes stop_codon:yes gene_type:complete
MVELNTAIYKKTMRILNEGWNTRSELAEVMYLSEQQISGVIIRMKAKGITIISRPSARIPGYVEYSIGEPGNPLGEEHSTRSIRSTKDMLIIEVNRIRIEAKSLEISSIENMAVRALNASGVQITEE